MHDAHVKATCLFFSQVLKSLLCMMFSILFKITVLGCSAMRMLQLGHGCLQ